MTPDVPVLETPQVEQVAEVEAPLSITDHAAQFDPKRDKTDDAPSPEPQSALPANASPEQKSAHHSEQQRREKTGEFTNGKKRHRAQSQQATAGDSPRIQELTRKLREAEARLAAPTLQQIQSNGHAPMPQPRQEQAPPQPAAPQRRWLGDAKNDPEPQERDFGGDPMKYLDARYEWLARGVNRYDRHEGVQQQQQLQRATSWAQRVEKAIEKYQDYAQVAFGPTTIPSGSPVDQFIDADDNGAEVLYYLQSNPAERDAVLRLPVIQQMKHLALLSQRYDTASTPSAAAVSTTSAPRSNVRFLPPRPPNVVRTEAQRAENTAAPTDGSLGLRAHAKRFSR